MEPSDGVRCFLKILDDHAAEQAACLRRRISFSVACEEPGGDWFTRQNGEANPTTT